MSRLGCKCGHTIGTSESPSPYDLYVYYEAEVREAIKCNPKLRLMDFIMDWDEINGVKRAYMIRKEPVIYNYCTECKRVYESQPQIGGHWLRVYKKASAQNTEMNFSKLKRIYVFTDIDSDAATEKHPDILLNEYIGSLKKDYYMTENENLVYVFDSETKENLYIYELEEAYEG